MTESGIRVGWIQLRNLEEDFTFVVAAGMENNVGYIQTIYRTSAFLLARKTVKITGTGKLSCTQIAVDSLIMGSRIRRRKVRLDFPDRL